MKGEGGPVPVLATILFLRPQGEQGKADALAAILQAALVGWEPQGRVVLQGEGGSLAVVGQVAPAVALDAARRTMAGARAGSIGIGLHQGPVTVRAEAAGAAARIAGEGLLAAASLAQRAGELPLASAAFRQALFAQSPRAARALQAADGIAGWGEAPVFRYDPQGASVRAARGRRLAAAGIVLLLLAGFGGRVARERWEEAHRPAVVVLDIRPSGEVFVDGQPRGNTPPLTRLSLPPGAHTIEVRGRAKPLRVEVDLDPGQEIVVKHVFVAPPVRRPPAQPRPKPGPLDRFKFW